jgi:CubicO group peptidase (beta-lactamase class C family)
MRPPLAVVFAVTTLVHSPGPGLELRVDLEQRVDAAVVRVKDQIPGLSVAVVVDNRVAYAKGVGTISLGTPKPALADTQYRLASVTKAITAVGVLKLVEQGRVDLDRPAKNYCPALSPLDGAPTVREFLLHQSGMRHTSDPEDETITGAVPRLASSLSNIVREPLRFRPGRKTLYTSWGYTALGCVIETVSGESYAQFITRNVLTPGSMQRTTFDEPTYAAPNFSPGFRMRGGTLQPSIVVDTRFKMPASGAISTVNDLARFAIALFERRLVPEPFLREMLSTRPAPDDQRRLFTAGWTIGPADLGTPGYNYNGSMEGTTAVLAILPERQIAVALLANRERFVPAVSPVVREALRAAIGLPPQ